LEYLYQKGNYKNTSLPDIVILDINLPQVGGMTVLETVKEDERFRVIPVIIFGTSGDQNEVKEAYSDYANCYIVKPVDYDKLSDIMKGIEKFWFEVVTLPKL